MSDDLPIIKIEGLSKAFQGPDGEFFALEDINLEIKSGEIFGIIGMSGAGKSTLSDVLIFWSGPPRHSFILMGRICQI